MNSRPVPGHAKIVSVNTAPASRNGISSPINVTNGRVAFLNA